MSEYNFQDFRNRIPTYRGLCIHVHLNGGEGSCQVLTAPKLRQRKITLQSDNVVEHVKLKLKIYIDD